MTVEGRASLARGARLGSTLRLSLGVGLVALLAVPLGCYAFFATFQEYDDEGYLLISLRDYARGGLLYDEVYSQYGPAYFQLLAAIFRVGRLAFVHTHGRALALALVIATAILCAVASWRLARSLLIALVSELLIVQALLPSRDEPLHPGALLALLLGGLVLAGTALDGRGWRAAAGVAGAVLATTLLVKVNVGVFAAAGVAAALVAGSPLRPHAAALRVAVVVAMAALPVALLGPRLYEPTVRAYLAVALASGLGVAAVAFTAPPARAPIGGRPRILVLSGAVVLAACLGWELVRGTTLAGLLDGIVLGPLRHPGEFFVEPELGPAAFVTAAAGLGSALVFAWARRRGWTERPTGSTVVGLAQLSIGFVLCVGVANRILVGPLALTPFLWIGLAGRPAAPGTLGPLILVMIAALQTLHAYPVAGTQVAWATFLAIPVGGLALAEGWRRTREALSATAMLGAASRRLVGAALGVGLAAVTASGAYATHRRLEEAYHHGVPLSLPGAERIRVPAEQAALYRYLVRTLASRCRTFVTQPGLYSLHLFTGMEPPTRLNATVWMILLSDAQQQRIVDRLAAAPPPVCALRRQRRVFRTPLARYIEERFVTLFELEYFEFRVRREPDAPAPA
ncbi:MAG TPA: hypothetical protein VIE44_03665 [Methylomirabilota bacterium]